MDTSRLRSYADEGLSQRQIAERMGCSQTTVRWHLSHEGLSTQRARHGTAQIQAALPGAVGRSGSWGEVERHLRIELGRSPRGDRLREIADQIGIPANAFLARRRSGWPEPEVPSPCWRSSGDAAEHLAAAWYTLHGFEVALAPARSRCDLLVADGGSVMRVQVKSTRTMNSATSATIALHSQLYDADAPSGANGKRTATGYPVSAVDEFFGVWYSKGGPRLFRLPYPVVEGARSLSLPGRVGAYEVAFPGGP